MRTNRVGQALNSNAQSLPSDNYGGEFFNAPRSTAIEGAAAYNGNPKVYNMGYIQGQPHVILESYYGQGVVVRYLVTGVTYSWNWNDRNDGWSWAKDRKEHVRFIR